MGFNTEAHPLRAPPANPFYTTETLFNAQSVLFETIDADPPTSATASRFTQTADGLDERCIGHVLNNTSCFLFTNCVCTECEVGQGMFGRVCHNA